MSKMDYSRLLDDEFLNAGGRVRVRVATRGASRILGASFPAVLAGLLAVAMLGAILTVVVFLGQQRAFHHYMGREHALHEGDLLHRGAATASVHAADLENVPPNVHQALINDVRLLHHILGEDESATERHHVREHVLPDNDSDHHEGHDDGSQDPEHKTVENTEHIIALHGGNLPAAEEHGIHEHLIPGDVVLEDHHIANASESEENHHSQKMATAARHTYLLCVPRAGGQQSNVSSPKAESAVNGNATKWLTRREEDNAKIVSAKLNGTHVCHVVIVDVKDIVDPASIGHPSTSASPLMKTIAAPTPTSRVTTNAAPSHSAGAPLNSTSTAPTPVETSTKLASSTVFPCIGNNATRSTRSYTEDNEWTIAGDPHAQHDDLILDDGTRVAVVRWTGEQFFGDSPFRSNWRGLIPLRASGGIYGLSEPVDSLLNLAARLLLIWKYGGTSVDLQAPSEHIMMVLTTLDKTDKSHAFLETTRATVLSAPQTCNAIIFEMLKPIEKALAHPVAPSHLHEDDADEDVSVFDGVLDAYCGGDDRRSNRRRNRPRDRRAVIPLPERLRTRPFDVLKPAMDGPSDPATSHYSQVKRNVCRGNLTVASFV